MFLLHRREHHSNAKPTSLPVTGNEPSEIYSDGVCVDNQDILQITLLHDIIYYLKMWIFCTHRYFCIVSEQTNLL